MEGKGSRSVSCNKNGSSSNSRNGTEAEVLTEVIVVAGTETATEVLTAAVRVARKATATEVLIAVVAGCGSMAEVKDIVLLLP